MTTTTAPTPRTRLLGLAAAAAPIALLSSTVVAATDGGLGQSDAGGAVQVYAFVLLLAAVVALTRLIEAEAPRAAAVLTGLGLIGTAGGISYGVDSIAVANGSAPLDETTFGAIVFQGPGTLFPIAFVALGVLLTRTRTASAWAGVTLAVAAALFPVSRIGSIEALAVAVDALLAVALVPLGLAFARVGAVASRTVGGPVPTTA